MSRARGFTLVEVLVASLLLVLAIVGVATMSLSASGQLRRSGRSTSATALVQQRIEFLRSQSYTASVLNAGTITENLSGSWQGYTRTTTVEVNVPRTNTKRITVTATAPDGRTVQAMSILTNHL